MTLHKEFFDEISILISEYQKMLDSFDKSRTQNILGIEKMIRFLEGIIHIRSALGIDKYLNKMLEKYPWEERYDSMNRYNSPSDYLVDIHWVKNIRETINEIREFNKINYIQKY